MGLKTKCGSNLIYKVAAYMWKHVNCMWKPRKGESDVSTLFLHETSKEIYGLILEMVLTLMIICLKFA